MTPADDEPTRAVPPKRPRPPARADESDVVVEERVRTWEDELADRIDSLRNWLVLIALISVAALGVAIYALVEATENDDTGSAGASSAQVRDLQQRVDDLEDNTASDSSISELKSDVSSLQDDVQKLESADSGGVSEQQFSTLQQQVTDLSEQVDELENQPAP